MSENEFDTNIDNYTIEDLLDILNLSLDYDEEQVKKVTNNIIDKFTEENKVNEVKFFLGSSRCFIRTHKCKSR